MRENKQNSSKTIYNGNYMKMLLFFFLIGFVLNSYAITTHDRDDETDSLLVVQRDSLQKIYACLQADKDRIVQFNNKLNGKIDSLNNVKRENISNLESIKKDSTTILQLGDSIERLRIQLSSVMAYKKFAEQCAIKYANNKLYYPYDRSVEDAINLLYKIKDNPYPQLIDILQSYKDYYYSLMSDLNTTQKDGLAKAVTSKTKISTAMMAQLRNDYANKCIVLIKQSLYCQSPYYKTPNSIHYMDVIVNQFNNAINLYKKGIKNLDFSDILMFSKLFHIK